MKTNQELEDKLAAINAMMDPHAHLKAAWAAGKRMRLQSHDRTYQHWQSINTGANFAWTFRPDCYEIEPDATPADPWAKASREVKP